MLSPDRLPLAVRGGLLLLIIVAVLHTLDRQGEFVSRTDFLWKAKLKVEQEEVEVMRGINKVIFSSFSFFFCKTFSDFLPSFPSTSSWLCLSRQHFFMFYTTTSSRACFRNKTINKSSTNPTDSQFFSALLHWSRGRAKKASEIKCDRANTEEIFCRHHLFIHERNEFTLVQHCEAPFTTSPLALSRSSSESPLVCFESSKVVTRSKISHLIFLSLFFLSIHPRTYCRQQHNPSPDPS